MTESNPSHARSFSQDKFNDAAFESMQSDPAAAAGAQEGEGVGRRHVLKVAALGAMGSQLMVTGLSRAAESSLSEGPIEHHVPAAKGLSKEWFRTLYQRGRPIVYKGEALATVGMPIGGIGAGQLYLRGDGTLGCWQIFNGRHFAGVGHTSYAKRIPDSPVQQGFAVVIDDEGKRRAHRLSLDEFPDVEFTSRYPIANVRYAKDEAPVAIAMEAFSPFIPLNAKDSALPATVFHIKVKNTSKRKLRAHLLSWLENAVGNRSLEYVHARRVNRVVADKGRTVMLHTAEEAPADERRAGRETIVLADFEGDDYGDWKVEGEAFGAKPARGTLPGQNEVAGYQGQGLVNSFRGNDVTTGKLTSPTFGIDRRFLNFLIGGGHHAGQTCLNLVIDGKVVKSSAGHNSEQLQWHCFKLDAFQGAEAHIEIVDKATGSWGHINVDQIELSDTSRLAPTGPLETLPDIGSMALAFDGKVTGEAEAGDVLKLLGDMADGFVADTETSDTDAVSRTTAINSEPVELAPGKEHTFTAVLSWYFPNRQTLGKRTGHMYNNWGSDAADIARYVLDHQDRLTNDTRLWCETLYDSTLPYWLLHRLNSTVANLATGTCQWWEDGRFWAYEGVYCCDGTCTHVWNYAHGLARLFPELERSAREMQDLGIALRDDGLVAFRGEVNLAAYAADGQAGTVLKCYREHQMSADDAFLKRNWPKIKRVLEYSMAQDGDADGLIETSQHNTFDINFFGPNTFVGSLYLAALRAAEEMATEVGDTEFAKRARRYYESGRKLTVEKLWNGEYYTQLVDLDVFPTHQYGQGCLSDQLFGQGWAHQLGLGYIYPVKHVTRGLQSVWKYNWAPDVGPQNAVHKPLRVFASPGEAGLFTCTWPKSRHLDQGVLYKNEVWTGIEYQVAGHMVYEGMLDEGLSICRAIDDRYDPNKRNPYNEVECGDHYARALASWGVFTNLAGYACHGPKGRLAFAPRLTPEKFRTAFTTAEGWGTFDQQRQDGKQTERITVRWGKLRVGELAFQVDEGATNPVAVTLAGQPVKAESQVGEQGGVTLKLAAPVEIGADQTLEVVFG